MAGGGMNMGSSLPAAYQPGTLPGQSVLDGPPPNPASQTGSSTGTPLGDLVAPMQASQLPPAILTGIIQTLTSFSNALSGIAQSAPQFGPKIGALQAALNDLSADVMSYGAGPTSPVSTGAQFPGGGIDSGGGPPKLG